MYHTTKTISYSEYEVGGHLIRPQATLLLINKPLYVLHFRRESLGQTKTTTINYLKNIRLLFGNVIKCYLHENGSFPKGFDLLPCQETVTRIKQLEHKLDLLYKRTTKQQPQELFQRKTTEATTIPDYTDVVASLEKMYETIEDNLKDLEKAFEDNTGKIVVRSEKTSTYAERMVSAFTVTQLRRFGLPRLTRCFAYRYPACGENALQH